MRPNWHGFWAGIGRSSNQTTACKPVFDWDGKTETTKQINWNFETFWIGFRASSIGRHRIAECILKRHFGPKSLGIYQNSLKISQENFLKKSFSSCVVQREMAHEGLAKEECRFDLLIPVRRCAGSIASDQLFRQRLMTSELKFCGQLKSIKIDPKKSIARENASDGHTSVSNKLSWLKIQMFFHGALLIVVCEKTLHRTPVS